MINEGYCIPPFAGEKFLQTYEHHLVFLFDVALRDALSPIDVLMFWLEEFLTKFPVNDHPLEVFFSSNREARSFCYGGLHNCQLHFSKLHTFSIICLCRSKRDSFMMAIKFFQKWHRTSLFIFFLASLVFCCFPV